MTIVPDYVLVEPKSVRDHQLEHIFPRYAQEICNQVNTTQQIAYCYQQVSYEDSPELRQLHQEIKQGLL